MVVTDRDYDVTGDLTPDATGYYDVAGVYNGEPYLRRQDGAYFIWWDGGVNWYITTVLGTPPGNSWTRTDPAVEGDYFPEGTFLGVATVSVAP